jgi:hypothetical protein
MSDEPPRIEPRKPFELLVRHGKYCRHRRPEVCREERVVTCADCGATLDPFDVLCTQAEHRVRLMFEAKHLQNEIARHRETIVELKRQEQNAKARIRRAAPEPPEERGRGFVRPGAFRR